LIFTLMYFEEVDDEPDFAGLRTFERTHREARDFAFL